MGYSAITQYVDVAQLVLYAFWIFFAGLVYYLVRENHREGYPMVTEDDRGTVTGWPVPGPKVFATGHGEQVVVPGPAPDQRPIALERAHRWAGSPLEPTGNPMLDGVGPGSWAARADRPDVTYDGTNKVLPVRAATECTVAPHDLDPRGLTVYGADGEPGGTVVDLWVDVSETLFRYLELEVPGGRRVLLPMNFARVKRDRIGGNRVVVKAVMGAHFAGVPGLKNPDQVTMLEEEKIQAYYGGGTLYADPRRVEPLL